MATMMWCADCEKNVFVYDCDVTHFIWVGNGEYDLCTGPFFTSAPPEILPDNWQDELVEPSDDELLEMDKMSELFLWDLGLTEK